MQLAVVICRKVHYSDFKQLRIRALRGIEGIEIVNLFLPLISENVIKNLCLSTFEMLIISDRPICSSLALLYKHDNIKTNYIKN
jgi:hypothetical protein